MTATSKLHPAQRVSAAWRIIEPLTRATPKAVMRRYGLTERELVKAVRDLRDGNFKKGKHWNPLWDDPDVIHHPVDSIVMSDIENGSKKGADAGLLMDPDFDPINGVCHFKWGHDEVLTLCEGLPYRLLEIVRDTQSDDELYQEAVATMQTPLFDAICLAFGIDRDELVAGAIQCRHSIQ